ncbi:MAG: DUF2752 domain-containing protein [Acidimicrobiales bacterium]
MANRVEFHLRGLRYAGGAMLVLAVALPHVPGHPGLPCPLRTITGVPCPFCGLTTSVEATMGGHLGRAFAANPFGIVAVAMAIALLARPKWERFNLPLVLVAVGVLSSWLFELHRYHFL